MNIELSSDFFLTFFQTENEPHAARYASDDGHAYGEGCSDKGHLGID